MADVDFFETFSQVKKPSFVRVVLSLAVSNWWDIRQVDVNNTFLNGKLEEDVFMIQLEGFMHLNKLDFVYKLHKSLYSLK